MMGHPDKQIDFAWIPAYKRQVRLRRLWNVALFTLGVYVGLAVAVMVGCG